MCAEAAKEDEIGRTRRIREQAEKVRADATAQTRLTDDLLTGPGSELGHALRTDSQQ